MSELNSDGALIPTAQVRARYGGVSHMWVERRLHDDATFPKPLYIAKRRYWRLTDLINWERNCAVRTVVPKVPCPALQTAQAA